MKLSGLKNNLIIFFGAILYALSVVIFTAPNNIAPGGLTGLGTLLNYLFNVPIGTFILIMNVPLFVLGYRFLGKTYVLKSFFGTGTVSVAIDLLSPYIMYYKGDMILAAVFGGLLNGIGLALIFSQGGSSGGTDIIASLINKKLPHFSVGRIILAFDAVIVSLSAIVYNSIESGLYAVISIFVSSRLIDLITFGFAHDNGKLMIIISQNRELANNLIEGVSRGVTVLSAKGGYSGESRSVLLCALRPNQVFKAKSIINNTDKNAFVIVTNAVNIAGLGFMK